jgi:hypothetical protein
MPRMHFLQVYRDFGAFCGNQGFKFCSKTIRISQRLPILRARRKLVQDVSMVRPRLPNLHRRRPWFKTKKIRYNILRSESPPQNIRKHDRPHGYSRPRRHGRRCKFPRHVPCLSSRPQCGLRSALIMYISDNLVHAARHDLPLRRAPSPGCR